MVEHAAPDHQEGGREGRCGATGKPQRRAMQVDLSVERHVPSYACRDPDSIACTAAEVQAIWLLPTATAVPMFLNAYVHFKYVHGRVTGRAQQPSTLQRASQHIHQLYVAFGN